jgi:hypothetical protein
VSAEQPNIVVFFWDNLGWGEVGCYGGDAVSKEYTPDFPFTGGRILKVEVHVGDDVYLDIERDFHAAMAPD